MTRRRSLQEDQLPEVGGVELEMGELAETVVAGTDVPGWMPGLPAGVRCCGGATAGLGDCGPATGGEVPFKTEPERCVKLPTGWPLGPMVGPA
jgi:hypothetical protein